MWRVILRDARDGQTALVAIAAAVVLALVRWSPAAVLIVSGVIAAMITVGRLASSTPASPMPPAARGGATTVRV